MGDDFSGMPNISIQACSKNGHQSLTQMSMKRRQYRGPATQKYVHTKFCRSPSMFKRLSGRVTMLNRTLIRTCGLLFLLAPFLAAAAAGNEPRLLKDVNTRDIPTDSLCGAPVTADGTGYFCGGGYELWMTDGTAEGTRQVRDADDRLIKYPSGLVASGELIFVMTRDGLWRSDGTSEGTFPVLDDTRSGFDDARMIDVAGDLFLFRKQVRGSVPMPPSLWKSDGTIAGTRQVAQLPEDTRVNDAAALNGTLIFSTYEHEIWASDGSDSGTRMLRDLDGRNYRDDDNNLTQVGSVVYFSLETSVDTRDLWKTDGTTAGTELVRERVAQRFFTVENFVDVDGTLFFTEESDYRDTVIWRSDGTTDGTQAVTKLQDISTSYRGAAAVNGRYLLSTNGAGLWRSDGTSAGTIRLTADLLSSLVVHRGLAYFAAENGTGLGTELWATDGDPAGTRLVRDIHWQQYPSSPEYFGVMDSGVIFQATRGRQFGGQSLWFSDGTEAGTRQVLDLIKRTHASSPSATVIAGDRIYFLADSNGNPYWRPAWSLWQSDGTSEGTVPLFDPMPGQRVNPVPRFGEPDRAWSDEFSDLGTFGGDLFVSARDPDGWGLWRTVAGTGIEAATWRLPVTPVAPITGLTEYDDALFFFSDTKSGRGLWRLGDDISNATLVQDGLVGPRDIAVVRNRLVFTSNGDDLWWSDGTAAGTRRVAELGLGDDTRISTSGPDACSMKPKPLDSLNHLTVP